MIPCLLLREGSFLSDREVGTYAYGKKRSPCLQQEMVGMLRLFPVLKRAKKDEEP